jgi:hypothetical protein
LERHAKAKEFRLRVDGAAKPMPDILGVLNFRVFQIEIDQANTLQQGADRRDFTGG